MHAVLPVARQMLLVKDIRSKSGPLAQTRSLLAALATTKGPSPNPRSFYASNTCLTLGRSPSNCQALWGRCQWERS